MRDGDHRIVYRFGVRGELIPDEMTEKLRDILGRARSLLDIAMFTASTAAASPPLTESQERGVYFPIAETQSQWDKAIQKPHMMALEQSQRDALRAMQPFATGDPVITWFQKIHNDDKHRTPLQLATIPDPEFVMVFEHIEPPLHETREYWLDWVEPLPQVAQRVEFVECRSVDVIRPLDVEDVPIALAIWVDDGWRDIQHMLWDVIEFTVRGCQILDDGDTGLADSFKTYFGHMRAQLDAFTRMMRTGDPDAEREWKRLSGDTSDTMVTLERPRHPPGSTHGRLADLIQYPPEVS
ncbi:hypothetical protein A4X16_16635 [Microbacterium sp. H83]|nr:hypothetical protein A4X16_16635 [Microbacterium sp. H83]